MSFRVLGLSDLPVPILLRIGEMTMPFSFAQ